MAKKVWSLIRVMFFMLKKGISKTIFFTDLNMVIKRGKIAGKALHKLLFHHHHNWASASHPHYLRSNEHENIDDICIKSELLKALDMLTSVNASPALLGSGKSPMVRQLRITDSPFPVSNGDEDGEVDEAAEKFIIKFYNGLRWEN